MLTVKLNITQLQAQAAALNVLVRNSEAKVGINPKGNADVAISVDPSWTESYRDLVIESMRESRVQPFDVRIIQTNAKIAAEFGLRNSLIAYINHLETLVKMDEVIPPVLPGYPQQPYRHIIFTRNKETMSSNDIMMNYKGGDNYIKLFNLRNRGIVLEAQVAYIGNYLNKNTPLHDLCYRKDAGIYNDRLHVNIYRDEERNAFKETYLQLLNSKEALQVEVNVIRASMYKLIETEQKEMDKTFEQKLKDYKNEYQRLSEIRNNLMTEYNLAVEVAKNKFADEKAAIKLISLSVPVSEFLEVGE